MNRRNKYLTLSHIVEKCVQPKLYTLLRIRKRQNERILIFIPPLKVGDFITRNKARNAFLAQGFLPLGAAKLLQIMRNAKCGYVKVESLSCKRLNAIRKMDVSYYEPLIFCIFYRLALPLLHYAFDTDTDIQL